MFFMTIVVSLLVVKCIAVTIYESDVNFRIDPGSRTCFFEKGNAGHTLELFYQVLEGQYGDSYISFDVIDPNGMKILADHKKVKNSILMNLEVDGDYSFCLDNSFTILNSKLVFVSVVIEPKEESTKEKIQYVIVDDAGNQHIAEEIHWTGNDADGEAYYINVEGILESVSRTLKHVVKSRQLLNIYGALKSRDTYLAFEDTFIVVVWSTFQITFMCLVGIMQVYLIKKLFSTTTYNERNKMY